VEHRGAVNALHDQFGAARTDVLDARRWKAVRCHVLHDFSLAFHRAAATGAAHDEIGAIGEDFGVAAGGQERTELGHGA
jgi:hypothetical protein